MPSSVQRMLRPMANAIVGSAMSVAGGKKRKIRPSYKIARGVRRRGPRRMKTFKLDGMTIVEDRLTGNLIIKFNDNDVYNIPINDEIRKLASPKKLTGKAVRSLLNRIFYGVKPGKKISSSTKQMARRFGLIMAGVTGGAGAGAALVSHKRGRGKGHEEGYIRALEDVLSANKGTASGNISKGMEELQREGVTLSDLKIIRKQISAVPAGNLGREDLQPSRRKRYPRRRKRKRGVKKQEDTIPSGSELKKVGYIPAISRPLATAAKTFAPKIKHLKRKGKILGQAAAKRIGEAAKKHKGKLTLTSGYIGAKTFRGPAGEEQYE